MNSATTLAITSNSPAASSKLGERLGHSLRGGDTVELISDLGGGKTTLVQGMAQGLGYTGQVTSPSFTISRIYRLPQNLELHHFDFYRLDSSDIVNQALAEAVGQPDVIAVIEWAQQAASVLPADRLRISLAVTGPTSRQIRLEATGPRSAQIVKDLS